MVSKVQHADVFQAVGAICSDMTYLEFELQDTIVALTRSKHVEAMVRGERATSLHRWIKRLLAEGAIEDVEAARAIDDTAQRAMKLSLRRDDVVHSVWGRHNQSAQDHITGTRTSRAGSENTEWTLAGLEALRTDIVATTNLLATQVWNALAEETGNLPLP